MTPNQQAQRRLGAVRCRAWFGELKDPMNNRLNTRLLQAANMLLSRRLRTMPAVIGIETSTACNRRCWYCPQSLKPMKQQIISQRVWDHFKFRIEEYKYRGLVGLTFYNEFTLLPDCERYVAEIAKIGARPLIFSNGDKPGKLMECLLAGAYRIIITEHPPFRPEWVDAIRQVQGIGGRKVSVRRLTTLHDHAGQVDVYTHKPSWCVSPISGISIGVDGQFALCCMDYGAKHGRGGTIFTESFAEQWAKGRAARRALGRGVPQTALCETCLAPNHRISASDSSADNA